MPAGEVGELQVRGPNIMKGYYRNPEETAAAIDSEGWFNTRDLARLDDGNLFIVGRTKDLIVHQGFNVYPAEVEAVLNAHPAVVRSAVVGRAIDGDEEVVAFVELQPGSVVTRDDCRNMRRIIWRLTSDHLELFCFRDAGDADGEDRERRAQKTCRRKPFWNS